MEAENSFRASVVVSVPAEPIMVPKLHYIQPERSLASNLAPALLIFQLSPTVASFQPHINLLISPVWHAYNFLELLLVVQWTQTTVLGKPEKDSTKIISGLYVV